MEFSTKAAAVVAGALLCASGTPALAAPVSMAAMTTGYSYFNRPGADGAVHDAAVADCAVLALNTVSVDRQVNIGAGLLHALIVEGLSAAGNRATAASALENCMVVKGWRVVRVPEAEGKALAALAQPELARTLAPWIGAEKPHGEIVRTWNNDAADSANIRFTIRPGRTPNGHLSLKALDSAALPQGGAVPPAPPKPLKIALDPKWPTKPLKPTDIAAVPTEAAIILVDVRNVGFHNGIGLIMQRMGPDPSISPSIVDKAPDLMGLMVGVMRAKKEGNMLVLAIPPGRWRIASMGMIPRLNFCLGSPAFEIKAGEAVYAGSFDMGAQALGPNLDLGPAKAWLAGLPAEQSVRAAQYVNGTRGVCGDNSIYALEVAGAPFEAGYAWGGTAPVAR